jgi:hypothetical protein
VIPPAATLARVQPDRRRLEGDKEADYAQRFYKTTEERDAALNATFDSFQARPSLIANDVATFL